MILTDTHTHLYVSQFDDDRDAAISRAFEEGVSRLFLPNIDETSVEGLMALSKQYPGKCFPMMGLHPCSVGPDLEKHLQTIETHLFNKQNAFCAVGEIGLDYYWDTTYQNEQIETFKTQIEWAKQLGLPIVIHCRDAFRAIIDVLSELKDEKLNGVFHCFTGSLAEAHEVIDLGFYLGIGGVVTFKNSGLGEVVSQIDLKHLVLETDSPYLTPSPYRGKRNESSYLKYIAEKVAEVKQITLEEVAEKTTANSISLFKV